MKGRDVLKLGRLGMSIPRYLGFVGDYRLFKKMARSEDDRFSVEWKDHCAMIHEKTSSLGFDSHYIYHTAWAARVLNETRPQEHVDISSSLYFSSIVSAFVRVKFYEFRPADIRMDGLESKQGDILSLPMPDESVASLSCMHVVEHVGLGRYGDKIDPRGDLKAMAELKRVMAKDGDLLFVVPVGRPRIMYNAHRIYSFEQIRGYFAELELREFALIPDDQPAGGLIRGASPKLVAEQEYGCGCFWFKKPG